MTLLVLGISHQSAPIDMLDALAFGAGEVGALRTDALAGDNVEGLAVLSTCNRLELIADVTAFHGGLADLGNALVSSIDKEWQDIAGHFYAHYDTQAMEHLLKVSCGLDSMAIGEAQILGQLRSTFTESLSAGALTSDLSHALQQALRVGKRAHSETGLDEVARSLFSAALEGAQAHIGSLRAANALVIGAGAMSGLVVSGLHKEGVAQTTVLNRTVDKAERLVAEVGGRARELTSRILAEEIADADLIVSCTGAREVVVTREDIQAGLSQNPKGAANKAFVDLALPHDIDPSVREFEHVALFGLGEIQTMLTSSANQRDTAVVETVEAVRAIIAEELTKLESGAKERSVAPTVTALRTHAKDVLAAETKRLEKKIGAEVDDKAFAEIRKSLHRVAEKLIHTPTVKVKELAVTNSDIDYAQALMQLFDLPTNKVAHSITKPETKVATASSANHVEADGVRPVADHTLDIVEPEHYSGRTIRLGTRRSKLARSQSTAIAHQLAALTGWRIEIVEVVTEGDVNMSPLTGFGGTGVFVSAVRQALHQGKIDIAVHSLKDLPTTPEAGIQMAAIPPRVDPADVLIGRDGLSFAQLPAGSVVGTGSPRRAVQLRAARPDIEVRGVRGNVDTRIAHVRDGRLDAVVLAAAGVRRIGRLAEATDSLDFTTMLPAPGQGALAIETRGADSPYALDNEVMAADAEVRDQLKQLHDETTDLAVTCERAILSRAEAGCSAPIGALATIAGSEFVVEAVMADDDGNLARTRQSAPLPVTPDVDLGSSSANQLSITGKELARLADELGTAAAENLLGQLGIDPAQSADHLTPVKVQEQV
ncbi:glutamyl-tRNA reductase /hydroxymethylbilane synthase [Brevibacterium sp. 239c]|uniref:glutamyl-tRNA reductase n=1 Tax=Brevibacterium sp. 239c TaxID=1965356 RepID=UPI000C4A7F15|nr:glutamyl-tRNA reductase [Brevibacterium sp. 239c]SMX76634.1 glutamyl-tRNA reductase /hydroxymethylbilane synthase [Brevibacterium sp. 239c]